ncbi:MAG: AbiH family protein [Pseudomonadota bacterium]
MHEFSKLFIIGNGFDLSNGLKTSYKSFINSDFFAEFSRQGAGILDHLKSVSENSRWVDIEAELAVFSKANRLDENFRTDYEALKNALLNYLCEINKQQISTDSPASKLLLDNYDSDSRIVNFNYTKFAQSITKCPDKDSHNIHGNVDKRKIIFGVNDGAKISEEHNFLYKSCDINYGGSILDSWLGLAENIYFIGHSLGETDSFYFEDFFGKQILYDNKKTNISISFFEQSGFEQIDRSLRKITQNQVSKLKNKNLLTFYELK